MTQRTLKFRAWSKTSKKMLDRVLAGPGDPCSIVWSDERGDWVNFDEFCGTIMQFTGIYDMQGNEVYEGDIVAIGEIGNAEVVWHNGQWETYLEDAPERGGSLYGWLCPLLVIGNTYTHPQLLKKEPS